MLGHSLHLTAPLIVALLGLLTFACGDKGTAPTPLPTVTPTRIIALSGDLNFGTLLVGSTAVRTLTISNSGNALLTWNGLTTGTAVVTASATSGTIAVTVGDAV